MNGKKILGIDIGGSGIKGAIIDTKTGQMTTERIRIETPSPATPQEVALVMKELVKRFGWKGICGCGFPAVVQKGVARTAANIDKAFIGTNIDKLFSEATKCQVFAINDADAAGMAEMKFGAGKKQNGVVILITVGTGIGTVIFSNGKLVPNTELGHILLKNMQEAELYASDAARKKDDLSWKEWGLRFNEYLRYMEDLFWPDLFIIGGGASKKDDQFKDFLTTRTPFVMAQQKNNAGMVGAAVYARLQVK
jgi:polyphosphate glucokinase